MTHIAQEIDTQPDCWLRAAEVAARRHPAFPRAGERVAVVGCGTSWFMAQAYASLRESAGHGETDAFAASEFPGDRRYDHVVAITRSGTTTEVLDVLAELRGRVFTTAITADPATPVVDAVDEVVVLDFADERSVVQTRFATTALALLRASLGHDLVPVAADGRKALSSPLAGALVEAQQVTFLGRGWGVGLACEAALKLREAAGIWTESYPALDYRHGPITITGPGRVVWMFGNGAPGLADAIARTGGTLVTSELDPMADLVQAQRLAVALAVAKGLDPDHPRHLTRSVIITAA